MKIYFIKSAVERQSRVTIWSMKKAVTKNGICKYLTSPFDVEVFATLKSSNLTAKDEIKETKKSNFVVVAREQTGGRGRFERKFFSPKNPKPPEKAVFL